MPRRRTAAAVAILVLLGAGGLCARSASATASGSGYLPFPTGYRANVTQGNFGSFSHNNVYNYYAWDWVAASGSIAGVPVWSATNGTVAYARNTVSGQVSDFNSCLAAGNFVLVDNHDGTFTQYLHMQLGSEPVHAGDNVRVGQVLGAIGNTGFTGGAYHLHTQWLYQLTNGPCGIGYSTPGSYIGIGVPATGQTFASNNPGISAGQGIANLLRSASFEGGGTSGWQVNPGANAVTYHDGTAHDGQYFLQMNTGSLGGGGVASLYQDVPLATTTGQSFSFSVWLRSATGAPAGVCVVLWGLGGTQEGGGSQQTCTTLSTTAWRLVTVPLDTHASNHSTLRAQILMESAGVNYDVDGAQLINNGLSAASFEGGSTSGWQVNAGAQAVTYSNTTAHDGQTYLEMNTGSLGGGGVASLWQDVAVPTTAGQSFSFAVWLRSPTSGSAGVCVVLWGLGGTAEGGGAQQTCTTLSSTAWRLVTVPLDTHASSHSTLRAQVYMETAGINYDVDGAQLVNTGLSSASFEGGDTAGWQLNAGANAATYHDGTARDGQYFLQMNTGSLGGGVATLWQDVVVPTTTGQSFIFSAWMRSASGSPAGICVVLWGLGGTQEGGGAQQTCTTLSDTAWRLISVPLDTHASNHSTLRAQLIMETAGVNYDVDGATLEAGGARTVVTADLGAVVSGPATASTAQPVTYTVTSVNHGPDPAVSALAVLLVRTDSTVVSKPANCTTGTTTVGSPPTQMRFVACPLASPLLADHSGSVQVTVSFANTGAHAAVGYTRSNTDDPVAGNNAATKTTNVS